MHWLLTAHVRRYHRHSDGSGHVWQGRFKAFPVQGDGVGGASTTCRCWRMSSATRCAKRGAGLEERPGTWPWGSAGARASPARPEWLADGPVAPHQGWLARLALDESEAALLALRKSVNRGTPFGDPAWQAAAAERLGLTASLRPRGRPRMPKGDNVQCPLWLSPSGRANISR